MKTIRVIVLSLLVSFAGVMKAQEASVDTIMKHIRYLSSSRCEGRMAGTDGYDRAVQYAVGVLESYGVKPYYEDWESECCRHYTSGSENASNIEGVEDPDENSKEPKTQNADRERLGEYFRRRYEEAADETASSERKSSSKSGKRQETAAESTGEDLLTHSGEEDLWEPTSGGYDELEKYVEEVRKKTSAAPDGTREPWARCKVGHMDAVVGNIRASEVYYTITGDPLSGECPPQNLELSGLSFCL